MGMTGMVGVAGRFAVTFLSQYNLVAHTDHRANHVVDLVLTVAKVLHRLDNVAGPDTNVPEKGDGIGRYRETGGARRISLAGC